MSLAELTKSINAATEHLPKDGPINEEERQALMAATEKLRLALESPLDALIRVTLGAWDTIGLKLGVDLGLFNELAALQGESRHASDFAKTSGADPALINRVLRLLASSNLAKEVGEEEYAATPLSALFSDASPLHHSARHIYLAAEAGMKVPEYLRQTGYKIPEDASFGPFQFAMDTKLPIFDWLSERPADQVDFSKHMEVAQAAMGPDWFTFYPVEERLLQQPLDASKPFFVDIGGNNGKDLGALATKLPDLKARFILEDLPKVIENLDKQGLQLDSRIERVKYDFFTEQPVKGAKAYYMRTVLHDWPDKQAHKILGRIRDAMDKDSVLLINETALPEVNAPSINVKSDWIMMTLLSALDRTMKQYKALLEEAGFEVRGTWRSPVAGPSTIVFEAAKKP